MSLPTLPTLLTVTNEACEKGTEIDKSENMKSQLECEMPNCEESEKPRQLSSSSSIKLPLDLKEVTLPEIPITDRDMFPPGQFWDPTVVSCAINPTPTDTFPVYPVKEEPKIIFHLMRHGEALHNVQYRSNYQSAMNIHDPHLTNQGFLQCNNIPTTFPHTSKISLILSSPMLRTLQTTVQSFPSLLSTHKIIAWKDLREWGNKLCHTGQSIDVLKASIKEMKEGVGAKNIHVDYRLLDKNWCISDDKRCLCHKWERVYRVKVDLVSLCEVLIKGGVWKGIEFAPIVARDIHILLVSHGGFLADLVGFPSQQWRQTQIRSFTLHTNSQTVPSRGFLAKFNHDINFRETDESFSTMIT